MTYDGSNVILFGGYGSGGIVNDTWKWNGSNWVQLSPSTSPSNRYQSPMTYDGVNIILFGGNTASSKLSDTWKWTGTVWTQITTSIIPNAVEGGSMAYDGNNIIMFGGINAGTYYNNTWKLCTVPGAPTGVTVAPGNKQATVSWTAPKKGGLPITAYTVTVTPGNTTVTSSTTSTTITGLTDGTLYTFAVTATNRLGVSPSASGTATTWTAPGVPTGVTVVPGNKQAVVSWTPPATGGSPITGYTVTVTPGNTTVTSSSTLTTITGLTDGTLYTFAVTATNVVGVSQSASVTATTWKVPGVPTGVTVAPGNKQAAVSWTAPSTGGTPITGYTVTVTEGGTTVTSKTTSTTSTTITGLTDGTLYTFAVTATNAVGVSQSVSGTGTTWTVPGVPTGVTVTPGNKQATVSWTAPATGGSPITGYTVKVTPGNKTVTTTTRSTTITGLTVGTKYTFAVTAKNIVGTSPSASSTPVTLKVSFPIINLIRTPIEF